jgi:hypothetical protein
VARKECDSRRRQDSAEDDRRAARAKARGERALELRPRTACVAADQGVRAAGPKRERAP